MSRIFIASMPQDRRGAEPVDATLKEAGFETWTEWNDLPTGVSWEGAVRLALKKCSLMVLVLTRTSGSADMMITACRIAKDAGMPVLTLCMDSAAEANDDLEPLLLPALWLDCFEHGSEPHPTLVNFVEKLVRPQKGKVAGKTAPRRAPQEEDPFHDQGAQADRPGMFCGHCGTDNPEFLKSCRSCGASMVLNLRSEATHIPCPICTSINPPNFKWCRACGSDLHATDPEETQPGPPERKTEPAPYPATLPSLPPPCGPECVGRLVGPWRLLRWIGRGGQGSVYEAIHVYLRTTAALKVLQVSAGASGVFHAKSGDSIRRGLRGLAVLNSPHVARTLDFGESDLPEGTRYFIVTELVKGRSLRDMMSELAKDDDQSFAQAMRVFRQLCLGVQAAHEVRYFDDGGFELTGVLHGDIKPANVIVTAREEVKLIDFLLFKTPPTATDADPQTCAAGTPGYMAPEQLRDNVISVATDIFELGATLLQMLTLSLPGSLPQVESEAFGECVKELNARAAAVVPVLRRCLAPDPAKRFGSVKELLAALPS